MTARATSSGTITFGMLAIPVKLYTSVDRTPGPSFHMLHKGCGARLRQRMFCETHAAIVEAADIEKGYEVAKDRHVTFGADELAELEPEGDSDIAIKEFVPLEKIPDGSFQVERRYYLGPAEFGPRGYALFWDALRGLKAVAVGKFAARGKVVFLRPLGDGLVLDQLFFAEHVRAFGDVVELDKVDLTSKERAMARELVKSNLAPFDLAKYKDEASARFDEFLERKLAGKASTPATSTRPKAEVINLFEALQKSLEATAAAAETAPKKKRKAVGRKFLGAQR